MGTTTRVTFDRRPAERPADLSACLVQIHGPTLGKTFLLEQATVVIGREDSADIGVPLDTVSRRHCSLITAGVRVLARDEHSTNGTFVNDRRIVGDAPLRNGDLVRVGSAIFKFLTGDAHGSIEAHYHDAIYRLTISDGLTGLFNKRHLLDFLEREMARCARHARDLACVLLDIDYFKTINDSLGHLAGDAVLRELAATLRARVRREECLARYGGEEFCLVLPEASPVDALKRAEELRQLCADHSFHFGGEAISVTLSAGVANLAGHATPIEMLAAADAALYRAKRAGRNRVLPADSSLCSRESATS